MFVRSSAGNWQSSLLVALSVAFSICIAPSPGKAAGNGQAGLPMAVQLPAPAGAKPKARVVKGAPAWAAEARWYEVTVSRFHNAEIANDPDSKLPWTADWPTGLDISARVARGLNGRAYGGDLQGLAKRLPYLKDLGINVIYLSPVFLPAPEGKLYSVDLRHIEDSFGVAGSSVLVTGETAFPNTWKFSESDRIFLDVIEQAHQLGIRVVLSAPFGEARAMFGKVAHLKSFLFGVTRKWLDPNGDGDPSDGIDGWIIYDPKKLPHPFWREWRALAKRINPEVLLVVQVQGDPEPWLGGDEFDTGIDNRPALAVRRLLSREDKQFTLDDFFGVLYAQGLDYSGGDANLILTPLCNTDIGRPLTAPVPLAPAGESDPGGKRGKTKDDPIKRCRIAMAFQYFFPGTPVTLYGSEVGMYGGRGPLGHAPMWWKKASGSESTPVGYRQDLASYVKWLNELRTLHAPLKTGDFRMILTDHENRLFAVSRTLPGDEVILLVNYGDTKRQATLKIGEPGKLVGVLNPQLRTPEAQRQRSKKSDPSEQEHIPRLPVGGSRPVVDAGGNVRIWIEPMSIRVVLVNDKIAG